MRKQKLTQKEAARLIRNCGRTLVVRDREFIVKLHGKGITDKSTYFTNDLEDAVHTAKSAWGREKAEKEAKEYIERMSKTVEVVTLFATKNETPAQKARRIDASNKRYPSDDESKQLLVRRIEYWWDRISRNWIIQAKDGDDNQIGAAEYAANSRTLPGALEAMRSQYPNVACVKS